jgi:hypothetical protein
MCKPHIGTKVAHWYNVEILKVILVYEVLKWSSELASANT